MEGLKEGTRIAPGSLPHGIPSDAVREQIAAFPEIPAWPQLPNASPRDRMGFQELTGMPVLTWPKPDEPVLNTDHPGFGEVAELLRSENRKGPFDRGAFMHDDAPGFFAFMREFTALAAPETMAVKGQCTGPVTLGLCVKDGFGKPVLSSREGMEALVEHLLLHIQWQVSRLVTLGKPVVFFLDEPALGSTFDPARFGTDWKDIHAWIEHLLRPLQELGVVTGLHCCGPGPWPWVPSTSAEMFHFDGRYMNTLTEDQAGLSLFLKQGGALVWGMVPTHLGASPMPALEMLKRWDDLAMGLASSGVDRSLLAGRSLFSTACGLGASKVQDAANAVRRLHEFTDLWRTEWVRA